MNIKTIVIALALGLAPLAAASAQTAAAVPPPGVNPAAGVAPGVIVKIPEPPKGEEPKAESALTSALAALAAGKPNYDEMESTLADAVKSQADAVTATLKALGPLTTLEYTGYDPHGVWKYHGQFANGQADLMIGFGPSGKIQTLWFKPVAA